jgi:hypothetical protein
MFKSSMPGAGKRQRWFDKLVGDDDRDPVEAVIERVLETPQARSAIEYMKAAIDRAANGIDPKQQPRRVPPQIKRPSRRLIARGIMHFAPGEPLDQAKIQKRRRELAMLCHPDQGGSTEAMTRINQAADILLDSIK